MADQHLLTRTLSEFAATLVRGFAISDVLHDLAERVTAVLRVDSAGVSVQESGKLRVVAALDERSRPAGAGAGTRPGGALCRRVALGRAVTVTDLSECASSWGTYPQQAHQAGIVAIAGIPMRLADRGIGALAAELGVSVDRAFELMRHHARAHNANLRTVAKAVVHLGLRP